jgi:hypothetical protein
MLLSNLDKLCGARLEIRIKSAMFEERVTGHEMIDGGLQTMREFKRLVSNACHVMRVPKETYAAFLKKDRSTHIDMCMSAT